MKISSAKSSYALTKVSEETRPWKVSSLTATKFGLFAGTFNGESRHDSRLYLDGKLIYEGNDETIGQGLVFGDYVGFAGENGNLLTFHEGQITRGIPLKFATHIGMFKGIPYVFDSHEGIIHPINCLTGKQGFSMPGSGIVMQSLCERDNIYVASCDADQGNCGVSGSDGTFIRIKDCLCLVKFLNHIFCSSGNKVLEWNGTGFTFAAEFPCEKIMHMHVNDKLWIAGSGPDSLWVYDGYELQEVVRFPYDAPVSGSLFRTRVTDGYFARCRGGNTAELYKIGIG